MSEHVSVLLAESLEGVAVSPTGRYIDATFGRGGHSRGLLEVLSSEGRLMVIDKDPTAIAVAQSWQDPRLIVKHGSFAQLADFVQAEGWDQQVDGILMDLGVSSPQLDNAERGFSFLRSGPLDMRMDTSRGQTAAQWLAQATEQEIADIIWRYGEERQSRRIARAIVHDREQTAFTTTDQLAGLIERVVKTPPGPRKKHPATKSFQAIRMHINQELQDIEVALEQAMAVLAPGGRLAVISFHSLEDRLVKQFMRRQVDGEPLPRGVPIREMDRPQQVRWVAKVIKPSEQEMAKNPRARSSRLRIVEKLLCA